MIIYPAIDLKDGRVVRLKQGDFNRETVFDDNPLSRARQFEKEGATWLHLVDLDGARDGCGANEAIVRKIKNKTNLKLQLGGGIRSLEKMEEWFKVGIDKLVIGTLALKEPLAIGEAVAKFGAEKLVISIDARDGKIATDGWLKQSGRNVLDFAKEMVDLGVSQVLYTDISRDGMLVGPDFQTLEKLVQIENLKIIASGGISSYEDLVKLKKIGVYGAIIGQALYQGILSLKEILQKMG
ncbi:1-(5-phosphoribosyl)-5-[(5-phosphoribosylamino)methylideneamino]imidazole-4-carboxamide isomerase [Anoxybacter fermentans]|uniref:1-(5-phosphoribosyl)-5-[(5-phosphoribosylamino)methylideneamino] imidazole-4-carboxamide isomerase n=1 Tax=Anoxybacter fermentans TaxID=1323375 RepID=A0A3S9T0F1_9FIRM|nr:1-(5-phosphoribosyl)-5-[(5-phosphoribosylamino)methylideneamino]imidazole-4-carboxamide isomerase [Anoxybacter fermentans]AZR74028.1 1-(5-phosphoribosyl)-5-[(5-phosphoribosylamino)methylideneamino]imidazole-4-carboxamide isomerase [Anoxybacter fermentans]